MSNLSPQDRAARVLERCRDLALCTEDLGRITRRCHTNAMKQAHEVVARWMEEAGLAVRVDPAGNIIGRREGNDGRAPTVLVGSHLDSVPNGGAYDGVLGVVAGIEIADSIRGKDLPLALDIIGFADEEGVRFDQPYLGSAAIAGCFSPEWLNRVDATGVTLRQAMETFGLEPDRLPEVARPADTVAGFLEIHIEQGPVLLHANCPLGVVDCISGQERLVLRIVGEAGHAGTVPLEGRRDALVGAAQAVLAVRRAMQRDPLLRATVGALTPRPGVRNAVAGLVDFCLDVRHRDNVARTRAVEVLLGEINQTCSEEGLQFEVLMRDGEDTVPMDEGLTNLLAVAVGAAGHRSMTLSSGAGHDAAIMATRFPTTMLFVRHPGLSHHPDESVSADDIAAALTAASTAIRTLASGYSKTTEGAAR